MLPAPPVKYTRPVISKTSKVVIATVILLMALIAGILPALQARRLRIADALRR